MIDLLKLSKTYPENRGAVEIVFRQWFSNEQFVINSPNLSPNGTFNETLDVVQYFGHFITRLKIDYRLLDTNQSQELNMYLNDYCAESLVDIELVHCDDDKIVHLRGPFKKVEYGRFLFGNLRTNASRFDEIFPSIRHLDLSEMYYTHAGCFEYNFSHLENLTLEFWYGFYPHTMSSLEKRLQLNPQLKHVTINRCTWDMLEMLGTHIPKLETLILEQFYDESIYQGKDIHFESMKVLKFKPRSKFRKEIGRIPIVFGNLEEIEFHNSASEWIEIMQWNKQLRIVTTGPLRDMQFFQLLDAVPNLEEFCTGYNELAPIDNILRFMRKATNLKKLTFTSLHFRISNKIMEKMDRVWRAFNGSFIKEFKQIEVQSQLKISEK